MTVKTNLDLKGIIRLYPIAEILLELTQAELSGSLRAEHGAQKLIIYLTDGRVVYAVSNERIFRLGQVLLDQNLIDKQFLLKNKGVTNDLLLADALIQSGKISADEMHGIISGLCTSAIKSTLAWDDGEWIYSPHARLKGGVEYTIDTAAMRLEHSRNCSIESANARFQNPNEWFSLIQHSQNGHQLKPSEAFLLSRFDSTSLTLEQLISLSGLPNDDTLKALYSLWLGGLISRSGYTTAFSDARIKTIKSAGFELKTPAQSLKKPEPKPAERPKKEEPPVVIEEDDQPEFDLEATLQRLESTENYYQVLNVDPVAKVVAIRSAYFRLAKLLHPDRYHNEAPELLRRVERAFTELAQAHETLKSPDSRQSYDIKMRQAEREKANKPTDAPEMTRQEDQAARDFERGLALQLEGEFEAAVPFFARASYYAPTVARYHAHYAKALSMDEDQRHKAEKEFTAAIRLEPQNETFRIMLAEFFIRYKLTKRAEGELTRLLEMSPNNREARTLLDSLQR